MAAEEAWLRSGAAAARLRVSAAQVRRWADDGRITCRRSAGGHRMLLAADVERLAASLTSPARNETSNDVLTTEAVRLCRDFGAHACTISRFDGDTAAVQASCRGTKLDPSMNGATWTIAHYPPGREALSSLTVQIAPDTATLGLTPETRAAHGGEVYGSAAAVPLVFDGSPVGVVELFHRDRGAFDARALGAGVIDPAVPAAMAKLVLERRLSQRQWGLSPWPEADADGAPEERRGVALRALAMTLCEIAQAPVCDIYSIEGDILVARASVELGIGSHDYEGYSCRLVDYPTSARAVESGRPTTTPADLGELEETERRALEWWGYASLVSIPLVVDERVIGLAEIADRVPRDFTTVLPALEATVRLAAHALVDTLFASAVSLHNEALRDLIELSTLVARSRDATELAREIARRVVQTTGAADCDVWALSDDSLQCLASYDAGGYDESVVGRTLDLARYPATAAAIASREPLLIADTADERLVDNDRQVYASRSYGSSLSVPLAVPDRVVGWLDLYDAHPRDFADCLDYVQTVAQLVAAALENVFLMAALDDKARVLTLVNEAGLESASTLELRDVLVNIAHRLCTTLDVPTCDVYLLRGQALECVASILNDVRYEEWDGIVVSLSDWASNRIAVETRTPVAIASLSDPRLSEREREVMREWNEKSVLVVPLLARDRVIGTIELTENRREREFTNEEIAIAQAVCQVAALAIDNAALFADVRMRRREAEIVNDLARAAAASLDIQDVAAAAMTELHRLLPFERGSLLLCSGDRIRVAYGSTPADLRLSDVPLSEVDAGFLSRLRRERVVTCGLEDEWPFDRGHQAVNGMRSLVSAGLFAAGELVGSLNLADPDADAFRNLDTAILERVGVHLSLALENSRVYTEIKRAHLDNLRILNGALGSKDLFTAGHGARVSTYAVMLAREVGVPRETLEAIGHAAYLHDIGKLGVSDRVLLKAGRLTDREWEVMHQHPSLGADIIRPLFDDELVTAVRHHHEHFSGGGYPDGLSGDEIPLIARILCIADSYDAMAFTRPYRDGLTFTACVAELERCRGTQFDPDLVGPFLSILARLDETRARAVVVAQEAARRIGVAAHATLRRLADESRPEYVEMLAALRDVQHGSPDVRCITTYAVHGGRVVAVVDSDEDPATQLHVDEEVVVDEDLTLVLAGETPDMNVLFVGELGVGVIGLAPLRDEAGAVVGAVAAESAPDEALLELDLGHSTKVQSFANMMQTAAERMSRAEVEAITDGLTGLHNHRYLHERLREELDRAREEDLTVSLLFADLDEFKKYNDTHGHSMGDRALCAVARAIEECTRRIDMAARYGGEEFTVILPETDTAGAVEVAERIRDTVANTEIEQIPGNRLTISIGVATFPQHAQAADELIDKADWTMYLAKRRGRDRVEAFSGERVAPGAAVESPEEAGEYLEAMSRLADAKAQLGQQFRDELVRFTAALAGELGTPPDVRDQAIAVARWCDVGELTLPSDLLGKHGRLSATDWELVRAHPHSSQTILRDLGVPEPAVEAVARHHERFDGQGYPDGLQGDAIPLAARIAAVAIAYQTMIAERPYRHGRPKAQALQQIRNGSGKQFDPDVVTALERLLKPPRQAREEP